MELLPLEDLWAVTCESTDPDMSWSGSESVPSAAPRSRWPVVTKGGDHPTVVECTADARAATLDDKYLARADLRAWLSCVAQSRLGTSRRLAATIADFAEAAVCEMIDILFKAYVDATGLLQFAKCRAGLPNLDQAPEPYIYSSVPN